MLTRQNRWNHRPPSSGPPPKEDTSPSASPAPGERPHLRSPLLTLAHPTSLTAVRSSNRVTLRRSILGPWPAQPKGSHDGVVLVAPHMKVDSEYYNSELSSPTFCVSPSLSSTSLTICRQPRPFVLPPPPPPSNRTLCFHRSLTLRLYP
jgi:hypothetical protein